MKKNIRIVFMGTPEFAVETLQMITAHKYDIAAVVTVPDKPAGRGLKVRESAVKSFAVKQGIPVLQPANLKDPEFLHQLSRFGANLFIVVAFRKLPEEVWAMPALGTFNLHASLLPQYRGAAPINHAVMNGEDITGVTTFFLNSGIDTGKIILNRALPIEPDETAGELHDRLMKTGAELVIETIESIASGHCQPQDQPVVDSKIKSAPRLFREHTRITWNRPRLDVHNQIRGLSPYPGAWAILKTEKAENEIKILRSSLSEKQDIAEPGHVIISDHTKISVACLDGYIDLKIVQPAGKKSMNSTEFINGLKSTELRFL
ncbi:MAG: methionyl-tRNA formyltransferase [Lentimicrobiaceae bacterium]|nr:methionyl-tRNA formyltransferase [Lentimicrobiaceae bacterium]MCB9024086.1 methionyl-tRNA formyltransferase [Lentimicrobiaceae bacterium]MCO5267217.1 methionyl-tRNA formyltransferase [Lentimicrobium sp.]HPG32310.1 methionyl-tRNA formyltransferase [Lentimicrobium sp.]